MFSPQTSGLLAGSAPHRSRPWDLPFPCSHPEVPTSSPQAGLKQSEPRRSGATQGPMPVTCRPAGLCSPLPSHCHPLSATAATASPPPSLLPHSVLPTATNGPPVNMDRSTASQPHFPSPCRVLPELTPCGGALLRGMGDFWAHPPHHGQRMGQGAGTRTGHSPWTPSCPTTGLCPSMMLPALCRPHVEE